jgi:hypothetical protein
VQPGVGRGVGFGVDVEHGGGEPVGRRGSWTQEDHRQTGEVCEREADGAEVALAGIVVDVVMASVAVLFWRIETTLNPGAVAGVASGVAAVVGAEVIATPA